MGKKKLPPIPERDEFMKHCTPAMLDEYESMNFGDDSEFAWAWNDDMTRPVVVWRATGEPARNKEGHAFASMEPFSLSDPLMSQIGTKWPTMTEQMRVFITGDPRMASTRLSPPPKGQATGE